MRNILHVEADIKGQRRIPAYTVTQNDSVSIVVSVLDGGSPVNLDEVSTMTIACTRRDGAVVVKDGTQTGPNEVTFDLGTSEIEQTGKVDAVIQLYSADGRVSTIKFSFMVTKDPTGDGYVPSEEERTLIEVVLGDGPLTIERAEMAAASAEGATAYIDEKKPLIDKFTDEQTSLQAQLDEVARGATNVETSQARVSTEGTAYGTLKQRLDTEYEEVTTQLAQTESELKTVTAGENYKGAVVTFVDDNGEDDFFDTENWSTIIADTGVKIGIGVVTDWVGKTGYLTVEQLKTLQNEGHEIYSHTQTHNQAWTTMSDEEIHAECKNSQDFLRANGLSKESDIFVYSGGLSETTVNVKNIVRQYYNYALSTHMAGDTLYNKLPVDNWAVTRMDGDNSSIEDMKAQLDLAIENNGWLIFFTHSYVDTTGKYQKLIDFINYAKGLNVPILPFKQASKLKR